MSRIGKQAIKVPPKVKVTVAANGAVNVEGPKGKLEWTLPSKISAKVEGEQLSVLRDGDNREQKATK